MQAKRVIDENDNEKYYVEITEELDDSTLLVTSNKEYSQKLINKALSSYAGNDRTYSKLNTEQSFMKTTLTESKIEELAYNAQSEISKIQEINTYIDFYLNKDDIIGKTYEIIESNTNANYQLKYPETPDGKIKKNTLKKAKTLIEDFNKQIELESLIIDSIPYAYANGNRILYLRKTKYDTYQVEKYPLGMAQISDYKVNNEPLVFLSLSNIIGRLTGSSYILDGSSVINTIGLNMFNSIQDDVKNNFPKEIYDAYISKEGINSLIKLNTDLTGVIRTNNRGKKYGLSPIFKALSPALKLEIQEKSDSADSKARAKKIIFQQMSDKLLGEDGSDIDLGLAIYSHQELLKAWKNEVVLYTGSPAVKDLKYVEPKSTTDHFNTLSYYKEKVLSALGISFLNGETKQGEVSAKLNLNELMRVINRISEQLEDVLNKWYKYLLAENGIPIEYAPTITVLDSELLEMELRMQLVEKAFNLLGMSYNSAYEMLGLDYGTEIERRKAENAVSMDETIFTPRMNANTYTKDEDSSNVDNNDVTKTNKTTNQKVEEGD